MIFVKSKMRVVTRYWFVVPLLIAIVGLQVGLGLIALSNDNVALATSNLLASSNPTVERSQTEVSSAHLPASSPASSRLLASPSPRLSTSTPAPTSTPTFTPSPTSTFEPEPATPSEQHKVETSTPLPSPTPTNTSTPIPQPTRNLQGLALDLPILMYHYLSAPPPDADVVRRDLSIAPDQFEAHLAYLRQAGYETISLGELADAAEGKITLPPKPIILTFDDGYRDNYENAFPILKKYGYKATFFIFTQPIDANNVDYLSWDMVKEMHRAGMEFGSHSYRHYDLSGKNVGFLVYEILGSKEAIEQRIGEPVRFFSYPAGRYDDLTIQVLESAHFWGAVTTQWGIRQAYNDRFELERLRIRGSDTAKNLAAKLTGW